MSQVGIVAIARNEGDRLRRCLESLREHGGGATVVYVDSGSTDGSVGLAKGMGVEVVDLDLSIPFTAARARNEGFARLRQADPEVRHAQFLDGDCEIAENWLELARLALEAQPRVAVIFGRRVEKFPEHSLYNRLADVEWNMAIGANGPDGEPEACGGDSMIRVEAFEAVGGFNPSIPAGEEPELCQRLRAEGWSIQRRDAPMTWHDSAMTRFGQWSKRQFRTGYGGLDFSTRFGRDEDDPFRHMLRSARMWTLGWPLVVALAGAGGALLFRPAVGALASFCVFLAPFAQAARVAWKTRKRVNTARDALAYGALAMLAKPYQCAGQWLYWKDQRAGRRARLIEYKADGTADPKPRVPSLAQLPLEEPSPNGADAVRMDVVSQVFDDA